MNVEQQELLLALVAKLQEIANRTRDTETWFELSKIIVEMQLEIAK